MQDFGSCGMICDPTSDSQCSRLRRVKHTRFAMFSLFCEQAAYNIRANHPIFFYWMQDSLTDSLTV